jgi:hypothetical protein
MIRWNVKKSKRNYKHIVSNMMNIWNWRNAYKACNPYNRKDKEKNELMKSSVSNSIFGELQNSNVPWEDIYDERLKMLEDVNIYFIKKS